jgi:hypothetical protein
MSVEEDQKREGDIEGQGLNPVAAPLPDEEAPEFELGDKIYIKGGRLDGTRGRIYYMDEDIIRILPDGVSDRLVDINIVEDEDGNRDLDPKLKIDNFFMVSKRTAPAFVTQIDAQVGQLVDTFSQSGDFGIQYTVKSINEADDSIVLLDETDGELDLQFDFKGVPRDQPFAVLRPRPLPMAETVEAEEEEAEAEVDEFEFLGELEEEIKGIQERPSTELFYPDIIQRNDMFKNLLEALPVASQKNVKRQRDIRRFVELCMLLRNEIVSYAKTGEPDGRIPTSFQTIFDLLEKAPPALSRPVLDVKRSLYMDHSKEKEDRIHDITEIPGRNVEVRYLEDVLNDSNAFLDGEMGGIQGQAVITNALPSWYISWERFFKQYQRQWLNDAEGERLNFKADKEFIRAEFTDGIDPLTDGLTVLGPTKDGKKLIRQVPPAGLTQLRVSLLKGLGPRETRIKSNDARRIETGDEGTVVGQLLFPLSTERDLGTTRTGRLAKDIVFGSIPPRTILDIITDLSGVSTTPSAGGILSIGTAGNTLGNIALEDWIRSQPILVRGMGDALVDLKSLGLSQKEFTEDQQAVILEKINQTRALTKQYITEERQLAVKKVSELRLENRTFLEGEALEQFMAVLAAEPLLATRLAEVRARTPAYKDNDIAAAAGVMETSAQLFLTSFAAVPGPLARERHRKVRDNFLEALRIGLAKSMKRLGAGVPPQPNRCPHVKSLEAIRKIQDPVERTLTLARLIARFSSGRKDNWLNCSVCNLHLLCYHEELQMQEMVRPREKEVLHKELLLTFSNGVFQGHYMCKNCGQGIQEIDFDQGLEYDDSGKPMSGRAAIIDKDGAAEDDIEMILGGPADAPEKIEFESDTQTLIYNTTRQIYDRIGIYADYESYKRIVERVEAEIQRQPSREQYAKRVAEKKTQGVKSVDYDVLINRILVSAAGAHALLEAQTHIPGYVLRSRLPGCRAGLSGYPTGAAKDRTGLEYFSCAIAGMKINETPWNLTGFLRESSDKKRQELIAKSIESILTEALKTALVQQRITEKKAYLDKLYGSSEFADRLPEAIPSGFYPVPYAISAEDAAATVVVPAAATEAELARAWIQTSHGYARQFGTYVRGSPYSEASCCFAEVKEPRRFWAEKESSMPALPLKTPPRGRAASQISLRFKPRPASTLLPAMPEDLYYRVFLRVCYDGPRKGLPHEPGYTNICSHCGFVFPESPYTESPAPPQGKDLFKDWQAEIDGILTKGKTALDTQNVAINRTTFNDVLDATHRAFIIPKVAPVAPKSGIELFMRLANLEPEPFTGWRTLMSSTVERVSRLPPGAQEIDVADAYGALSNAAVDEYAELERRLGAKQVAALKSLMSQSPGQIVESIRTYVLIPFQRLIVKFRTRSLKVQRSYDLAQGTEDDLHVLLEKHLEYLEPLSRRVQGLCLSKLEYARDTLSMVLPVIKNEVRAAFLPGGRFGSPYILSALITGILSEFIDPNRVPSLSDAGSIDLGARAPIQILDVCLSRLQVEGLNFSEQQIRDMIARRSEVEKVAMINRLARMTHDEKKVELMKKRLGLGDWAVGGTKAIYAYDPDQYERERAQRAEMGMEDFGGAAVMGDDYGGGGAGAEGGYDAEQMAADDY